MMTSRGLRNHNPGNIRLGEKWQGLSKEQNDPAFCVFVSYEYGCRAILKLLKNYVSIYKCKSVQDIISRWAPSSENNTSAYIMYVANSINKGTTETLSFNKSIYLGIAKAIVQYENGPSAKIITKTIWEKAYDLL